MKLYLCKDDVQVEKVSSINYEAQRRSLLNLLYHNFSAAVVRTLVEDIGGDYEELLELEAQAWAQRDLPAEASWWVFTARVDNRYHLDKVQAYDRLAAVTKCENAILATIHGPLSCEPEVSSTVCPEG